MIPLIFGSSTKGAASLSATFGVRRFDGAEATSENFTSPPAGVHTVSWSGIVTGRFPVRTVPVRAGSGVVEGGELRAVYTVTTPVDAFFTT